MTQARRAAGLTIEQLSAATRVRTPIVRAIEQDDFSRCGGDVYARGHIRSLARAVGVDPAPLIARYDAEHGGRPAPTPVAPVYETERFRPEPRRPNWTAAMIAAIVAVIGFVGFTLISGGKGGHRPAEQTTAQAKATGRPQPPPAAAPSTPSPAEPSRSALAAVPADKVTVKLVTDKGKSWVAVSGDNGKSLFEGLMNPGDSRTFTDDKRISLVVGNGGAVRMFVNGKDLGPAGGDGQLVRTDFTPGDPQAG
nr:RodZ domain-containing protein [Streptomyces sp. SID5468]